MLSFKSRGLRRVKRRDQGCGSQAGRQRTGGRGEERKIMSRVV